MKDFDRRVIPSNGLDKVIVNDNIARNLREIVQFEKARYTCTLYSAVRVMLHVHLHVHVASYFRWLEQSVKK